MSQTSSRVGWNGGLGGGCDFMIPCSYCGALIGKNKYGMVGTDYFHENCPRVVIFQRDYDLGKNPTGSSLMPDAINLMKRNGTDITMVSLIAPAHCSGLNVISKK